MKILYLSSEYPPETGNGGIGTYTRNIAECMAQRKHDVSVISASINTKETVLYSNGVTIYRTPLAPYPLPRGNWAYFFRKLLTTCFSYSLHRLCWCIAINNKIRYLLKRGVQFDIIEAPECGAESLLVPAHCAKVHILRFHTPWELVQKLDQLKETFGDKHLLPLLERIAAKRATNYSAPSYAIRELISKSWPVRSISVIRNPLPIKRCNATTGTGWIYSGRIERRKGVHFLVAAYLQLCSEMTDLPPLTLLGRSYGTNSVSGDYGKLIESMIKASAHNAKIRWIDHVNQNEVAQYLAASSVAFFPSVWENYPYSCLEAMASGCLVVASDCGGFPEIIENGKNGMLVSPGSIKDIYNAMKRILKHPHLIATLGNAAIQRVYDISGAETISEQMEHFYQNCIKELK